MCHEPINFIHHSHASIYGTAGIGVLNPCMLQSGIQYLDRYYWGEPERAPQSSSEYNGGNGVCHRTVIRSHTVCSNLMLAYSILLSKIVTTIAVPTARAHDDHSYLSGPAACIPQLPQVGPVSDEVVSKKLRKRSVENMNRDSADPTQRSRRRNQQDRQGWKSRTFSSWLFDTHHTSQIHVHNVDITYIVIDLIHKNQLLVSVLLALSVRTKYTFLQYKVTMVY